MKSRIDETAARQAACSHDTALVPNTFQSFQGPANTAWVCAWCQKRLTTAADQKGVEIAFYDASMGKVDLANFDTELN